MTARALQTPSRPFGLGLVALLATGACVGEFAEGDVLRLPSIRLASASEVVQTTTMSGLEAEELGSASYQIPGFDGRIFLRNGQWEDAARQAVAQISDGLHAMGDFDGDGEVEAATVLTLGTGGLDMRVYLLGVGSSGNRINQEAALLLGQRVQVTGMRTVNGLLELDMLAFAPDDDPCCPTRETRRRYRITSSGWSPR